MKKLWCWLFDHDWVNVFESCGEDWVGRECTCCKRFESGVEA